MTLAALVLLAGGAAAGQDCPAPPPVHAVEAAARPGGTLTRPAGAAPVAAVLMLHGHGGTRDEFPAASGEGMFARAAHAFAARGVAALRIDLGLATVTAEAAAAAAALDALAAETGLHPAVLGYSQGGLVALRMRPGAARVALWNPVLDPGHTYRAIYGGAAVDRALAGGERGGGTRAFLADALAQDARGAAAALPVPLLIVSGEADRLAPPGAPVPGALALRAAAGHDLGARGDLGLFDRIAACTAAFLAGRVTDRWAAP
jgi:dienelactone hydrolase